MTNPIRVTVWNEGRHEKTHEEIRKVYPNGMHTVIGDALTAAGYGVRTATLDQDENHGLSDEVLANTDVMLWWGHMAHHVVKDEIVNKVYARVLEGMGLIVLHSGHYSKIFRKLMGTPCSLKWREIGERERMWVVSPGHPIVAGLPEQIVLEHEEMYGEFFNIPQPDELVFVSWFKGGEVFRSGACWNRGLGKVFYFRPGHESYPTYYNTQVQQVLINACKWAAPGVLPKITIEQIPVPLEKVD
jgi:trehalose utilization protein